MKYLELLNSCKYLVIAMLLLLNLATASDGFTSNWQIICIISLIIVCVVLGIIYAISYFIGSPLLQRTVKGEAMQLLFTIIGVAFFLSFMFVIESQLMVGINEVLGTEGNLMDSSLGVTGMNLNELSGYANDLVGELEDVGEAASKTASCNFYAVGFSISTCSSFSIIQSPLTQALNMVYAGIVDLTAQQFILNFSKVFMFTVVLPLGLIFRSFHFTRRAGGALIAVAVGFGLIFPAGVLLNQYLVNGLDPPTLIISTRYPGLCDEFDPGGTYTKAMKPALDNIFEEEFYGRLIENVLLRSMIFTIINLFITLTFIQWSAGLFGAAVDLAVLTRLA